jgi:sulfate adenylyltransferase (ADP) / ATP adenylyltransferase
MDRRWKAVGGMVSRRRQANKQGIFAPGTLLERVRSTSVAALRCKALEPIHTYSDYLEDRGIRFLVRVVSSLRHKPPHDDNRNPFLPYETALYVADASDTHACILNKYNVVDLHLLIVTRKFEHQESLMTVGDFRALWRCLGEYDSLGFYNAGTTSGASQMHKHLQVVPLPLLANGSRQATPIEPLLDDKGTSPGTVLESRNLPFAHSIVFWDPAQTNDCELMTQTSWNCYVQMLRQHTLGPPRGSDERMPGSYNLLVTRRWMLLVPRVRECFQTISFNSLAFAGALLIQDPAQMDQLRAAGPFAALEWVAAARH